MADVGAIDRVELCAERVAPAERGGVHPVVRLAAEIIRRGVEIDPILFAGDLAGREIVEVVDPAGHVQLGIGPAVALAQRRGDLAIAMLLDQIHQERAVKLLRTHVFERLGVASLPMLDQVAEQLGGPPNPAFEEGEAQFREAPRHPAEEDALGDGVAGIGEMADVVVGEVGRRIAQRLAAAGGVKGRRDAEFTAFRPDRIVVVQTIDAEHFVSDREAGRIRIVGRHRGNPARQGAAEHADLGAELFGDEFEFGDRFVRRVHRDDRGRGHAVAEILEIAGGDDVIGADHGAPCLVVGDARQPQPGGGIDDGKIGADLVEPLVQQMRHHRRGAVEGVAGLPGPEARHRDLAAPPLFVAHLQRAQG